MKGIYKIENKVNGKVYIGRSVNLKKRINKHINSLKKGNHYNNHLQFAYNKYSGQFSFEVIECCLYNKGFYIHKREKAWVKFYNSSDSNFGYNKTEGGKDGSLYPFCVISASKRDRTKEKNPFFGKTHTEEVKKIISEKAKIRMAKHVPFKGKRHTEANKKILSTKRKEYFKTHSPNCEDKTIYVFNHKSGLEYIGKRADLMRKLKKEYGKCTSTQIYRIVSDPGRVCRGWSIKTCLI